MLLPATQVQTRNFGLFDRIFKKKENEGVTKKEQKMTEDIEVKHEEPIEAKVEEQPTQTIEQQEDYKDVEEQLEQSQSFELTEEDLQQKIEERDENIRNMSSSPLPQDDQMAEPLLK